MQGSAGNTSPMNTSTFNLWQKARHSAMTCILPQAAQSPDYLCTFPVCHFFSSQTEQWRDAPESPRYKELGHVIEENERIRFFCTMQ